MYNKKFIDHSNRTCDLRSNFFSLQFLKLIPENIRMFIWIILRFMLSVFAL